MGHQYNASDKQAVSHMYQRCTLVGALIRPQTRPSRSCASASPVRLAEQITDLKIELARRDADVQYLESQLAQANSASRPLERFVPRSDEVPPVACAARCLNAVCTKYVHLS